MPLARLVPESLRPQHLAGIRRYREGDAPPVLVGSGAVQVAARVDPAAGQGTGLGLSIMKGLAEANEGDVLYERLAEGGVCFGVRLLSVQP